MEQIRQRLNEPSTWAGLSLLALIFGAKPEVVSTVGQVANALTPLVPADGGGTLAHWVSAAAAGMAVYLREKQPPTGAAPMATAAAPMATAAAPVQVAAAQPLNPNGQ